MTEDTPKKPLFDTSQFDQLSTGLEQTAELLASYYASLLHCGIPDDLAKSLVIELQRKFMYPNGGSL